MAEKKAAAATIVTVSKLAFEVSAGGSSILSPEGRGGGGEAVHQVLDSDFRSSFRTTSQAPKRLSPGKENRRKARSLSAVASPFQTCHTPDPAEVLCNRDNTPTRPGRLRVKNSLGKRLTGWQLNQGRSYYRVSPFPNPKYLINDVLKCFWPYYTQNTFK